MQRGGRANHQRGRGGPSSASPTVPVHRGFEDNAVREHATTQHTPNAPSNIPSAPRRFLADEGGDVLANIFHVECEKECVKVDVKCKPLHTKDDAHALITAAFASA